MKLSKQILASIEKLKNNLIPNVSLATVTTFYVQGCEYNCEGRCSGTCDSGCNGCGNGCTGQAWG